MMWSLGNTRLHVFALSRLNPAETKSLTDPVVAQLPAGNTTCGEAFNAQ